MKDRRNTLPPGFRWVHDDSPLSPVGKELLREIKRAKTLRACGWIVLAFNADEQTFLWDHPRHSDGRPAEEISATAQLYTTEEAILEEQQLHAKQRGHTE